MKDLYSTKNEEIKCQICMFVLIQFYDKKFKYNHFHRSKLAWNYFTVAGEKFWC